MSRIYQSICVLTVAAVLPALQGKEPETTGPISEYWKAMQVSEAGADDDRFSRLVGYIEGTYGIWIADWWITEGVTVLLPKPQSINLMFLARIRRILWRQIIIHSQ